MASQAASGLPDREGDVAIIPSVMSLSEESLRFGFSLLRDALAENGRLVLTFVYPFSAAHRLRGIAASS